MANRTRTYKRHISTCHLVLTITLSLWRSAAADSGHAAVTAFVTADGSAGEVRPEFGGEAGVGGDGRSGGSLLEKYTFRETIKTGLIEAEHLRELPEFLEGIGLREKLDDFYRKSVFETRYLFTVNDMDLRLMGLSPEEAGRVKDEVTKLRVERDVTEERLHPFLARRNELTYGRLFLDRSVSSFEFYLAGFGPPAPVDEAKLIWADPRNACHPPYSNRTAAGGDEGREGGAADLTGMFVLAMRGDCSFVDKANNVALSNAAAMVLVNAGEDREELFRVSATLGGRSGGEEEPKGPEKMATVLVRGSALPSISKALEWGQVTAKLVPLECKPGKATCEALLPEERDTDMQVDSGSMSLISPATSRMDEEQPVDDLEYAFDFLSATFGSTLPRGQVPIVPAVPMDACAHLETPVGGMRYSGAGVLVRRGGCSFGVKAKNVQEVGGRVVVVADNGLGALQNVGAPDPLAKELYTPGVFVTARAGDTLFASAANSFMNSEATADSSLLVRPPNSRVTPLTVRFDPDNGVGRAWTALGMTAWPDELLETRVLARQLQATHASSPSRSQWIKDKLNDFLQGDPELGEAIA